jgi:signal peptidase I
LEQESGSSSIRRGDVISFRLPAAVAATCGAAGSVTVVKRVLALGGDTVVENHGRISINGSRLAEPYVLPALREDHSGRWIVPRGSLFVAGDDRRVSCDSRYWGPLNESSVVGKIVTIFRASQDGVDEIGPPIVHGPYPYEATSIPEGAMEPTIHCARPGPGCEGRHADLVIEEMSGAVGVHRRDIVDFQLPARAGRFCGRGNALERVIGLPGERIAEKRGAIYVDGKLLAEPYVSKRFRDSRSGSWVVPKRSYFVMADFRARSCDSRFWGPLPVSRVDGRVVEIIRQPTT